MSNPYELSDAQTARLRRFFPRSHGKPRVDDRPVLSGMTFINRNGLRWRDAPKEYGPAKTLHDRWKRWSDNGVFAPIMMGLAAERAESKTIMIAATCLKAHRTASSLRAKKGARAADRAHQGWHDHQVARRHRCKRPSDRVFMSAGPVSDYTGAAALLGSLPNAEWLLADRGYDASWLREALKDRRMNVCTPGKSSRRKAVKYDKRRNRIEIKFGRLKNWPIVGETVSQTVS